MLLCEVVVGVCELVRACGVEVCEGVCEGTAGPLTRSIMPAVAAMLVLL